MGRQRKQARALLFKGLSDSERGIIGPAAIERHLISPFESLAIESVERSEGTSGKEGIAQITDGSFDTALFVAASRATGASGEMVVAAEFEQAGMKADGLAVSFEDDGLEI